MKDQHLAVAALACLAIGCGWAVYSMINTTDYCPPPPASSAAALFAPCQAFEPAIGRAVAEQEQANRQLAAAQAQLMAAGDQLSADEHATVGIAPTKSLH